MTTNRHRYINMHSQVIKLTPPLAESWLEQNTFNRKVSRHTVSRYAHDMKSGAWTLNHQGIAFDENGVLVDGQHRLMAVIESGAEVDMMVTWGASRVGIDELRVRSVSDVIKFGGLSDWIERKHLESAKQMMLLMSPPGLYANHRPSTQQMVDFANKNKAAIQFSEQQFQTHVKGVSTAGSRAVVATAFYHFDRRDLEEFCETLYSGVVTSPERSAAIRAREAAIAGGFSGGGSARQKMAWRMARAVKAFCEKQPLSKLMEQSKPPFTLPEEKL